MKLTHRQQQLFSQFLDIYRDTGGPVHYTTVAERLGIGKITAYEMLRLLEERGLVRAEYQPKPERHGPGRSQVLFYPTQQADRLVNTLAGDPVGLKDWQAAQKHILQQLRNGKAAGYENMLADLLAHIPEQHAPLIFVTELVTVMILTMVTIQEAPEIRVLMERLRRIGLPSEISLSALSGIGLVLSVLERVNRQFSSVLLAHIGRYEDMLSHLSEENRHRLSEFTREATQIVFG